MNATEPFSLYPPNVTSVSNREVIGVITKIDHPLADVEQAAEWLRLAGCKKIFPVCSLTGEGVGAILEYLKEEGDILPWEEAKAQYDKIDFRHGDQEGKDLDYQITTI